MVGRVRVELIPPDWGTGEAKGSQGRGGTRILFSRVGFSRDRTWAMVQAIIRMGGGLEVSSFVFILQKTKGLWVIQGYSMQ